MSDDLLRRAEDSVDVEPDLPAWQEQEGEVAKEIVSTDRFRQLPTKFDVHEWAIMQDFVYSVPSGTIREDLLNAIHGIGAFRHFKDTLRRWHGVGLVHVPRRGVDGGGAQLVRRTSHRVAIGDTFQRY